jgi:hypothetical protein
MGVWVGNVAGVHGAVVHSAMRLVGKLGACLYPNMATGRGASNMTSRSCLQGRG